MDWDWNWYLIAAVIAFWVIWHKLDELMAKMEIVENLIESLPDEINRSPSEFDDYPGYVDSP